MGRRAGIIGCIQLIRAISTNIAVEAANATKESKLLIDKLMAKVDNFEQFAAMNDEFGAMMDCTRIFEGHCVEWHKYAHFKGSKFYPLHQDVVNAAYEQIAQMFTDIHVCQASD